MLSVIGNPLRPTAAQFYPIALLQGQHKLSSILAARHFGTKKKNKRKQSILLIGCSGSLGNAVSAQAPKNCTVAGADILQPEPTLVNPFISIPLSCHHNIVELHEHLHEGVSKHFSEGELDAIIVTAGGFLTDPVRDKIHSKAEIHEYAEGMDKMLKANVFPVVCASLLSMKYLKEKGLFLTIGAAAALSPTPNMAAYGLTKSASHYLIQTLGRADKAPRIKSHLMDKFEDCTALSILPDVLDTESNRQAMPEANFDSWTKPDDLASEIWEWIHKPDLRPRSGSLIKVLKTK
eukprot:119386_1